MTDALKRAHEAIERLYERRNTGHAHGDKSAARDALDAAVEEARALAALSLRDYALNPMGQFENPHLEGAAGGIKVALAAEERGRREALDLLHAPDACPGCAHVLALLKEPAQEKCPDCGNKHGDMTACHEARP